METTEINGTFKLAVITGASSGIGYELAKVFAKNKYDLLVVAEDAGIHEAGNVFRSFGVEVDALQANLATFEGVESLYQRIQEFSKPLDTVVINAGIGVSGEFAETNLNDEIAMVNLNIISALHLTKRILPDFLAKGEGRILFTSSVAANNPGPYYAVYAATKAFLQSFAEALRFEVSEKGVVVTALQPGATDTNFFARAGMLDTPAGRAEKDDPAVVAQQGFDALMAGKDHIVAGSVMNKVNAKMSGVISQPQGAKMQAKHTKPDHVER